MQVDPGETAVPDVADRGLHQQGTDSESAFFRQHGDPPDARAAARFDCPSSRSDRSGGLIHGEQVAGLRVAIVDLQFTGDFLLFHKDAVPDREK